MCLFLVFFLIGEKKYRDVFVESLPILIPKNQWTIQYDDGAKTMT